MENIDKFSHRTGQQDLNSELNSVYQESNMNNQDTEILNRTDLQNTIRVQLVENDSCFSY